MQALTDDMLSNVEVSLCIAPYVTHSNDTQRSENYCHNLADLPAQWCRPLYFAAVVCRPIFFLFSSPILSGRRFDVYHTSTHDVALVRI